MKLDNISSIEPSVATSRVEVWPEDAGNSAIVATVVAAQGGSEVDDTHKEKVETSIAATCDDVKLRGQLNKTVFQSILRSKGFGVEEKWKHRSVWDRIKAVVKSKFHHVFIESLQLDPYPKHVQKVLGPLFAVTAVAMLCFFLW